MKIPLEHLVGRTYSIPRIFGQPEPVLIRLEGLLPNTKYTLNINSLHLTILSSPQGMYWFGEDGVPMKFVENDEFTLTTPCPLVVSVPSPPVIFAVFSPSPSHPPPEFSLQLADGGWVNLGVQCKQGCNVTYQGQSTRYYFNF